MKSNSIGFVCLITAILLLTGRPLSAQQQPGQAASQIPNDSPALFRQFFQFHATFTEWLTTRKAGKSPAQISDLDRKSAAAFGLREADYELVSAATAAIAGELRAIDQEQISHANARARFEQHPVPAVLQQLETRRQEAVARGTARVQQTLTPEAWAALRGYINGPYRSGILLR